MTSRARFSKEVGQEVDFMSDSQIISQIAQEEDVTITLTQEVATTTKDEICSDFEESLSVDGIICQKVFTLTGGKLRDMVCKIKVYI